jgi:hypothetical protein
MKFDASFLNRKKKYDSVNIHQTNLSRVLGLTDITALGSYIFIKLINKLFNKKIIHFFNLKRNLLYTWKWDLCSCWYLNLI